MEVSLLVNHLKPLLEKNEVSLGAVPTEWSAFKHYAPQNIQGNSNIWPLLLTRYRMKFPNLVHLIKNSSIVSNQQYYSRAWFQYNGADIETGDLD